MKFIKRFPAPPAPAPDASRRAACACRRPPFHWTDYDTEHVGEDDEGAEVSIETCRHCGSTWLRYLIEAPQHSRSGRWWRIEVTREGRNQVSAASARAWIERAAEGFAGGSFFDSQGHAITAPIHVG